ncbi:MULTISPECIES: ABC transporter substrate-binding protein [Cohaesibacter]|uniref:ABC transporter substrate-binding protein n=1 Tax=Cohaesibacter TaxID=655352 RepID=UPI000DEA1016|nr:extracellular solute-binding protein [Cohaesibacter sp. CAU 1516]
MDSRNLIKTWLYMVCLTAAVFLVASAQARAQSNVDRTDDRLVIVTSFPPALFDRFRTEFEKLYPELEIFIRSKKTSAAISFIKERPTEPADVFWASSPDAFEFLKKSGHLLQAFERTDSSVPRIGSYPLDDPDGYYRGCAISGYGIVWNNDYLTKRNLPVPTKWEDLTNPTYKRHIGMSAPSRSGTTHLIVESILQSQGWEKGWRLLSEIGGNLATITARSFGVIDGVRAGRFGIGISIDFLGQSAKAQGAPMDFLYPKGTVFLPANIGLVSRTSNRDAAMAFIDFVLSTEGQTLLFEPTIRRLPVSRSVYAQAPMGYPNPFSDELARKSIQFDTNLSQQRYHMVNSLFDVMLTYRQAAVRRTWDAVHKAERLLEKRDLPDLVARIREARRLMSAVPVSGAQAVDTEFVSHFARNKPGISMPEAQVRLEAEWVRFARAHQDQALFIARDVLTKLEVADIEQP